MQPVGVVPNCLCFISRGTSVFPELSGFCRRYTICYFVVVKFLRKKKKILIFAKNLVCVLWKLSCLEMWIWKVTMSRLCGDERTLSSWTCPNKKNHLRWRSKLLQSRKQEVGEMRKIKAVRCGAGSYSSQAGDRLTGVCQSRWLFWLKTIVKKGGKCFNFSIRKCAAL